MNIRIEYFILVLAIQKNWKDENINLVETILQIIRYSNFMKENKKAKVIQITIPSIHQTLKRFYTNKKYVKMDLTTSYID